MRWGQWSLTLGYALLSLQAASANAPDVNFGFGGFDRDEPIRITADALEASDKDGERFLVFRDRVQVRQGPLELDANELEALYGADANQPDALEARGAVRVRDGARRAHCDEARYDRRAATLVCRGNPARLWDGEDQLSGSAFHFDLETRQVTVEGGTALEIHRELPGTEPGADDAEGDGDGPEREWLAEQRDAGPVHIEARSGRASDGDTARRIAFEGDVVVRQGDLELRAQHLEAVYPAGATQPEQLLARDAVEVRQADREARCEEAEYRPAERWVACRGDAQLRDGRDELEGDRIAFDLERRRVDIEGNARLWVHPADHEEGGPE
ncbi:MAG: LptA/OstA family protein [Myxococcota bacterium]